jgi:pyruvate dehydrogenase E2 component (dihydrolipoamide acetyltransferase)
MSDTVTMPKLGFDMQEGTLVRWVKVEGDSVNKGEVLAEIETDKATVEVESNFSGIVARQLVSQGDIVPVGTAIAIIAAPGEKVEEAGKAPPESQRAEEAQSAKQTGDLNPPTRGDGKQAAAETPGQAAQAPAAQQTEKERDEAAEKPVEEIPAAQGEEDQGGDGRMKVSPLARKIASENGLDLRQVKGTGPGGRIQRSDVEAALKAPKPAPAPVPTPTAVSQAAPAAPKPQAAPVPPAPVWAGAAAAPQDEVIKVSRLRGAIGRRMVESKTQVPHFYVTRTFKFEKLMELRKQLNDYLPDDQKLTVNDFIIKAVALNLRQFPNLNASLRGDEVVRHGHINVGSAVSLEGGLMTVVIKDADQKPLRLISAEMRELVARARMGKVRPEDIEGSTFSISNMGMYDVDHFIAIINPPEAGILAVGSAQQVPVVEDGQVTVGTRMKATISVDHRVSDGSEGARFLQALAAYLEEPMRLVL